MREPATGLYWTELRIFLQVARSRSFNKAGQELGTSHATVSCAVRRLEAELNAELVAAGARGVVLTPAGSPLSIASAFRVGRSQASPGCVETRGSQRCWNGHASWRATAIVLK
jgi:hypothetical protein